MFNFKKQLEEASEKRNEMIKAGFDKAGEAGVRLGRLEACKEILELITSGMDAIQAVYKVYKETKVDLSDLTLK